MTTALDALDYIGKVTNSYFELRMRLAARRIGEKLYRERSDHIAERSTARDRC